MTTDCLTPPPRKQCSNCKHMDENDYISECIKKGYNVKLKKIGSLKWIDVESCRVVQSYVPTVKGKILEEKESRWNNNRKIK